MKKVIIYGLILAQSIQSAYCVNAMKSIAKHKDLRPTVTSLVEQPVSTELVPSNFFDESKVILQSSLNSALMMIQKGKISSEIAIENVTEDVKSWLSTRRIIINRAFNDILESRLAPQSIRSELRRKSTSRATEKASNNKQAKIFTEKQTTKASETVSQCIPETFSERRFERILASFSGDLYRTLEDFQKGRRDMEGAIERVLERFDDHLRAQVESLQDTFADMAERVKISHVREVEMMNELHAQEVASLQKVIRKAQNSNAKLQKQAELNSQVTRIFLSNQLRPEKIMMRAATLLKKDFEERYSIIAAEYEKFIAFEELYGNADLNIVATRKDLRAIRNYLRMSKLNYEQIPSVRDDYIGRGNLSAQEYWRIRELIPTITPDGGASRFICRPAIQYVRFGFFYSDMAAKNRFIAEANQRIAQINQQRKAEAIEYAETIEFPLKAYNRLIDQFNVFVDCL